MVEDQKQRNLPVWLWIIIIGLALLLVAGFIIFLPRPM